MSEAQEIELFRQMQDTCYHAYKTFEATKGFYQKLAEKVLTLPLSRWFRPEQLSTVFVPFYLEDMLKFLKSSGLQANVKDGVVCFTLEQRLAFKFDLSQERVVSVRQFELDVLNLYDTLSKAKKKLRA
jgi:hypothetical protein